MFSIGEIMVIAVVGLVVIGPERLPKVARTLGHIFGRMQRYVSDVKSDISKEMQLEELKALQKSMKDTTEEIQDSVSQQFNFIESEVQDVDKNVQKALKEDLQGSKVEPIAAPESAIDAGEQLGAAERTEETGVDAKESLEDAHQQSNGIDLMAGLGFGYKVSETIQDNSQSLEKDQSVDIKKNSEVG
ncbi:MAG: Sec-independent protein translocase protein TatB [Proteobacteria bacterium]|nr:Sec-independent protein translocase protein TatB [Pseudomonadota bacterium]MDA1332531.1 Sec-independent protein translocase protein TatB [Pseudomonadota bacterium]